MARPTRTHKQIEEDIGTQSKVCTVCQERVPFDNYYVDKRSKDGRHSRCINCNSVVTKEWHKNNKERSKYLSRRARLMSEYGLSMGDYDNMLAIQGGVCAICGASKSDGMTELLHIDHDHSTGSVRGLLCHQCNTGLGKFYDNPDALRAAAEYLERKDICTR